ncbi:cysteine proteinase [Coniochaeta ligniaria NRRL 30616]|uniref:Cysteine proteinase n=1 Tax=Coniochaeta ligniaria NRRL 30616 TaxID=1408157 RepID=A0A1J7J4C6_9PEZI|nr:cysteine proteinase [Coniochaeta ligniaria NRRL 30616]
MTRSTHTKSWTRRSLIIALLPISQSFRLPTRTPRQLPWGDGIPVPVPADSVPAVDWSLISPSLYAPPSKGIQETTQSGIRYEVKVTTDDSSSTPTLVEWRDRNGTNYITTPQDQGICQACWAFAVTALIESAIRISHGHWTKRSEADVHDAVGAACESVGNAEDTLAFLAGFGSAHVNSTTVAGAPPGVADWPCDPYETTPPHGYAPCADRSGRATRIPMYQELGTVDDQKRWVAEYGPVIATFQLYSDFASWKPSDNDTPVYKVTDGAVTAGNHIALVVGYDDSRGAWVMKNSWGPSWGDRGFAYFGYGEANVDGWAKYGLADVDPDPWSRKRHQSGSMMQSGNGERHRNFELLLASSLSSGGGFAHVARDGTTGKWSVASRVGEGSVPVGQPVIVGTSANRDFAAVFVDEKKNLQQWSYSQANKTWGRISSIEDQDIDGFPAMTQDDDSVLVLVVRHADGTLNEYRQAPSSKIWTHTSIIANNITQSGPSLVVTNINQNLYCAPPRGSLYLVAVRSDGRLQLFSRPGNGTSWSAGDIFGSGVGSTPPVMMQDFFDTANETSVGGLQLAIAVDGAVQHWRGGSNEKEDTWEMVETVGTGVRHVWALVQGSFGGRMHMVTEGMNGVFSYWEWDGAWKVVETLLSLDDEGWEVAGEVSGG